jgi:hypothetical protein
MLKLWLYSIPHIIATIAVYVISLFIGYIGFLSIWQFGNMYLGFSGIMLFLSKYMYYIISLGLYILLYKIVVGPVIKIIQLYQIVTVTAVLFEFKERKLLESSNYWWFSFGQVNKNFINVVSSSVISSSSVKALSKLKDAVIKNDIAANFQKSFSGFVKMTVEFLIKGIASLLDMLDEIVVSYVWLAIFMYKKSPGVKQPKKRMLKQQARFMLEAVMFYIRVFPKLLIRNLMCDVGFSVINLFLVIVLDVLIISLTGSYWLIIVEVFLYKFMYAFLYDTIIHSFRVCSVVVNFYEILKDLKPVSENDLVEFIKKTPVLGVIAKRAKLSNFDGGNSGDEAAESSSGLININDMKSALIEQVNEYAKSFMLDEHDILNIDKVTGKRDEDEDEAVGESAQEKFQDNQDRDKDEEDIRDMSIIDTEVEDELIIAGNEDPGREVPKVDADNDFSYDDHPFKD